MATISHQSTCDDQYFLGDFLGYLIGQIFRLSKASDDQIVTKDFIYQPKTVRPIFLSLLLGVSLKWPLSPGQSVPCLSDHRSIFQFTDRD